MSNPRDTTNTQANRRTAHKKKIDPASAALLNEAANLLNQNNTFWLKNADHQILSANEKKQKEDRIKEGIAENLLDIYKKDPQIFIEWFKENIDVPTTKLRAQLADIFIHYLGKQGMDDQAKNFALDVHKLFAEKNIASHASKYLIAAHQNKIAIDLTEFGNYIELIYKSSSTSDREAALKITPDIAATMADKMVKGETSRPTIAKFKQLAEAHNLFTKTPVATLQMLYPDNDPELIAIAFKKLLASIKNNDMAAINETYHFLETLKQKNIINFQDIYRHNNEISKGTYEQLYIDTLIRNNVQDRKELESKFGHIEVDNRLHIDIGNRLKESFFTAVKNLKESDVKKEIKDFFLQIESNFSKDPIAQTAKTIEKESLKNNSPMPSKRQKLKEQWNAFKTKTKEAFGAKQKKPIELPQEPKEEASTQEEKPSSPKPGH